MTWDSLHQQDRHHLKYPSEHAVRFLSKQIPGRCLDLGCGAGRHTRLALDMEHEVYACDISAHALERTWEMANGGYAHDHLHLTQASMTALPYRDASFDTVLSYGTTYYGTQMDMAKALDEIHRVLVPGGVAFIVTRTMSDRRFMMGKRINVWSNRMTDDATGENGMTITFVDRHKLRALLQGWASVVIEKTETTRDGAKDSDWLVTATK